MTIYTVVGIPAQLCLALSPVFRVGLAYRFQRRADLHRVCCQNVLISGAWWCRSSFVCGLNILFSSIVSSVLDDRHRSFQCIPPPGDAFFLLIDENPTDYTDSSMVLGARLSTESRHYLLNITNWRCNSGLLSKWRRSSRMLSPGVVVHSVNFVCSSCFTWSLHQSPSKSGVVSPPAPSTPT